MNNIQQHLENIAGKDKNLQGESYRYLLELTKKEVDWTYNAWDDLLVLLKSADNRARSIAGQLLSNLAKSDPEGKMKQDFDKLVEATKDKKFVTARHILQSLWKVGIVNQELQAIAVSGLTKRYENCAEEKNCTLIRYDIIVLFRKMYDILKDVSLKETALTLINKESDEEYRKKYSKEWII